MQDLSIYLGKNKRFNVRTCVLPFKQDKVLLEKNSKVDYFMPIGGRVQFGEDSTSALIREIKEELGINVCKKDLKLKFIGEYTFKYGGKIFNHEIIFVYGFNFASCKSFDDIQILDNDCEKGVWIDLKDLKSLNIKPAFLKNYLPKQSFRHVIGDGDEKREQK